MTKRVRAFVEVCSPANEPYSEIHNRIRKALAVEFGSVFVEPERSDRGVAREGYWNRLRSWFRTFKGIELD